MTPQRILVVEDDARLRMTLRRGLQEAGFHVDAAPDGGTALTRLDASPAYAVIVLDIGLPDSDGRDVCQAIRSRGVDTPVLFLTARGQVGDQLSAFAAGGDDFLAKPFHVEVLVARLGSLARRADPGSDPNPTTVLHLDPRTHALISGAHRIPLTPTEYRILGCLIGSTATVMRRRALVGAAWPQGAAVSDNTLDQYVARLRRKLVLAGDRARVVTVHGVGYRLEPVVPR
ncbi:MAG: response regulator transcription factor [Nakamurella sp.]